MDFFERQAQSQRRTKWLLFYFLMAVVCIIAVLQIVFALVLKRSPLDPELLAWISGGVVVVVTLGSAVKTLELSQGGRAVATMLGGELISQHPADLDEQKVLNVVEEMALASGVPVPEVFVLPDETINAFAAGHGPGDTAIGITRGAIARLNRDELQGVIAHEFSHILHGDMKLNIRLIGLLNGILCLAIIGGILMRMGFYSDLGRSRRDNNGGALVILFTVGGIALYLVGWIGVFFGNLIKAAVSRQREFLADASAVQFTRNPGGIAGALWKIGQFQSRLSSPHAQEASHLFFGNGVGDPWGELLATHPPLKDRIEAIDPNFQPPAGPIDTSPLPPPLPVEEEASPFVSAFGGVPMVSADGGGPVFAAVPDFAAREARELFGACALIFSLLLDERDEFRQAQLDAFSVDEALKNETLKMFARRAEIPTNQRLALVDLVIPTLRHFSPDQYAGFKENIRLLVESDQQINLFEFVLQRVLLRHLDLYFSRSTGSSVKYRSVAPLLPDTGVLLSALTSVGPEDDSARDASYTAGGRELVTAGFPARQNALDFPRLDSALDRLSMAAPEVKRSILAACRETVVNDGRVDPAEYELLRAIADSLDCPMPPLAV